MRANLVRIGNSRGVRIPKAILDQCELVDAVELEVEPGRLVIRPVSAPRQGWEDAFRRMAEQGDDTLLDPEGATRTIWDDTEWEW